MNEIEKSLQTVLDKTVDGKKIFGTSFAVKQDDFVWAGVSGDFSADQQYFIASATKLFVTAIIVKLQSEKKLNLDDKINKYLKNDILQGVHVYKGSDYSNHITINHLLAHTSGLPDYFQGKGENGKRLEDEIVIGNDQKWTCEQSIERSKNMAPLFVPGAKHKAHYSDTNFQLLGKLIEVVTNKSFAQNCDEIIIRPLGLSKTYLYQNPNDNIPKTLYYKSKELRIPQAMASFGPDGGMVSTSSDMLVFIEAFFSGTLFPVERIKDLQKWNKIFFPMQSGIGIHKFSLPWIFNPFGTIPDFIGHSGLSGALAFYSPEKRIFVAGTVNQIAYPDISFRTMIKLANILSARLDSNQRPTD